MVEYSSEPVDGKQVDETKTVDSNRQHNYYIYYAQWLEVPLGAPYKSDGGDRF